MLRPKKFRFFETTILAVIALLLLGAGIAGLVLAVREAQWRLGLASGGILVLAIIYVYATRRGRPL
jgi:hypothetical protein